MLAADSGLGSEVIARVMPLVDGYEVAPQAVLAVALLRVASAEDVQQ